MPLLEVSDLRVEFPLGGGVLRPPGAWIRAVDGVSFTVEAGEVVALVGESGCGKSTVARAVVGLVEPSSGRIKVSGCSLRDASRVERAKYRRDVQMVFQDPFGSLNPRKTVGQSLAAPLKLHQIVPPSEIRAETSRLLEIVGMRPADRIMGRYPHEFSGGQRQRIAIARALSVRPKILVADEPVSALDVSIRAQVLTLMRDLQRQLRLGYLFISHDLTVVRSLADEVIVMYLGQVVERGRTDTLLASPRHPYTASLLAATPIADPKLARMSARTVLKGTMPSAADPPTGCRFRTRCPVARPECERPPDLREVEAGHHARCHFAEQVQLDGRLVSLNNSFKRAATSG